MAPGAPCLREQAVERRPQGGGEIIGIEVGADDAGTRALADHGCEPGVLATHEFGDAFNGIGLVGGSTRILNSWGRSRPNRA